MSSAISPIAMVTASGTASPGPVLVFGMFFWYLLFTVVPFLVGVLATPNTYLNGGVRRGTATQFPRDPGQPRGDMARAHALTGWVSWTTAVAC
jgi:hypothetical protein